MRPVLGWCLRRIWIQLNTLACGCCRYRSFLKCPSSHFLCSCRAGCGPMPQHRRLDSPSLPALSAYILYMDGSKLDRKYFLFLTLYLVVQKNNTFAIPLKTSSLICLRENGSIFRCQDYMSLRSLCCRDHGERPIDLTTYHHYHHCQSSLEAHTSAHNRDAHNAGLVRPWLGHRPKSR